MMFNAERAERWIWYVFLGVIAWQTRVVLWHADTVFQEWRSMSLYGTDILMFVLLVFAGARGFFSELVISWRTQWRFALLIAAACISLVDAPALSIGVYQLTRLLQGILFFLYLRRYAWNRFSHDWSALAFVIGAMSQSVLGIAQFLTQHDIGLRIVGETLLRVDMHGVAVFYASSGEKILRAYGSLPHPNVLAMYLVTSLWMCMWLWMRHDSHRHPMRWVWPLAYSILLCGLFVTFSRTSVAVWMLATTSLFVVVIRQDGGKAISRILITTLISTVVFLAFAWPLVLARTTVHSSDEALQMRKYYAVESLSLHEPLKAGVHWIGVGIGNFTTWLASSNPTLSPYLVAPVHNIYLLTYAEMGVLGVIALGIILFDVARVHTVVSSQGVIVRRGLLILVGAVMLTGTMDHFFFTIQQGRFLWWGVLALAAGASER
ncbi:MAG: hypothetical protein KBC02_00415 [Candidatus Pacebacteria bacterium]|nr:hypothetical protein [Candidatus Paceibacterota bacterium]